MRAVLCFAVFLMSLSTASVSQGYPAYEDLVQRAVTCLARAVTLTEAEDCKALTYDCPTTVFGEVEGAGRGWCEAHLKEFWAVSVMVEARNDLVLRALRENNHDLEKLVQREDAAHLNYVETLCERRVSGFGAQGRFPNRMTLRTACILDEAIRQSHIWLRDGPRPRQDVGEN